MSLVAATLALPLIEIRATLRTKAAATLFADKFHGERQIDLLFYDLIKINLVAVNKFHLHILLNEFRFGGIDLRAGGCGQKDTKPYTEIPAIGFQAPVTTNPEPSTHMALQKKSISC